MADRMTIYGFDWGNARVVRACEDKGYRQLFVLTPRQVLTIVVTPTGLIRTHVRKAQTQDDHIGRE